MKSLTSLALTAVVAVFALMVNIVPTQDANADGIWVSKRYNAKIATQSATIVSTTNVITDLPPVSVDPLKGVGVSVGGTAAASATINFYNGTDLVAAVPVAVATLPATSWYASPQYFDGVTVSPTTTLTGTSNIRAFVIQPK